MSEQTADLIGLTTTVVAAFVQNNRVGPAELPALIQSVHAALGGARQPAPEPVIAPEKVTAAQARKSITSEGLISFEDNKRYQSLKRHLSNLGLTPDQYRAKWGLPADYPMVAPAYAARRSELARSMGLGRKAASTAAAPVEPAPPSTPAKRGRKPASERVADR
jgi:predicted transcriptional regulator